MSDETPDRQNELSERILSEITQMSEEASLMLQNTLSCELDFLCS